MKKSLNLSLSPSPFLTQPNLPAAGVSCTWAVGLFSPSSPALAQPVSSFARPNYLDSPDLPLLPLSQRLTARPHLSASSPTSSSSPVRSTAAHLTASPRPSRFPSFNAPL